MLIRTISGHIRSVRGVVVLKYGEIVSASDDKSIKVWDSNNGTLIRTLTNNTDGIQSLVVLNNGTLIASGSYQKVKIWDPYTGDMIFSLDGHSDYVRTLTVLKNSNLASGSRDTTIKIWSVTTGQLLHTLHDHTTFVRSLAVLENGNLVSGAAQPDNSIRIWDPISGSLIGKFESGLSAGITMLLVLTNGQLVTSSSMEIKIWDKDLKSIATLRGHESYVWSLCQLQDGNLASGSEDSTVKIWEVI
jgi:WD40 repeat protein